MYVISSLVFSLFPPYLSPFYIGKSPVPSSINLLSTHFDMSDMSLPCDPDPHINGGKILMRQVDATLSEVATAVEIKALKVKSNCSIKVSISLPSPFHRDMFGIW